MMRRSLHNNNKSLNLRSLRRHRLDQEAFTLIELVVVMPIILLITGYMLSIMFDQFGQMVIDTAESNLRLEAQTMLLNLEDELLFATEYGDGLHSHVNDDHAPPGGWTNSNGGNDVLIVYETAINAGRRDPDRRFVRREVNSCTGGNAAFNPIAINNLLYFTEPNDDNEYNSLFKRTLTPTFSTCTQHKNTGNFCDPDAGDPLCPNNSKRTTCDVANVGTGSCVGVDGLLSEQVVDFDITYFDENNVITNDPSRGEKVEMLVTLGDRKYGKDIEITSRFIMKKIN